MACDERTIADDEDPGVQDIQRRAIRYAVADGVHVNPRILSFTHAPADIVARYGTPGSTAYGRTVMHVDWLPSSEDLEGAAERFFAGGLDIQVDCSASDVLQSEWLNWSFSVGRSRLVYELDRTASIYQTDDPEIQTIQRRAIAFVETFRHANSRVIAYEATPEDVVALYGTPGSTCYGRTAVHVDWSPGHRDIAGPDATFLDGGIVFEVDCTARDVIHHQQIRAEFIWSLCTRLDRRQPSIHD